MHYEIQKCQEFFAGNFMRCGGIAPLDRLLNTENIPVQYGNLILQQAQSKRYALKARIPHGAVVFGPAPYCGRPMNGFLIHFARPNQHRPAPMRSAELSNLTSEEN